MATMLTSQLDYNQLILDVRSAAVFITIPNRTTDPVFTFVLVMVRGATGMAELFSELLGKGQLRQYLLRTGPISLGDVFSQSPDRTKTLITLLRLTKEGDARVEGEANAARLFEGLAPEVTRLREESPPGRVVDRLQESIQTPGFANLVVSLSESGFRKAAAGI